MPGLTWKSGGWGPAGLLLWSHGPGDLMFVKFVWDFVFFLVTAFPCRR